MLKKPLTYWALVLSLFAHGAILVVLWALQANQTTAQKTEVLMIEVPQPEPETEPDLPAKNDEAEDTSAAPLEPPPAEPKRAYMDAPPAPTAAEWAQASTYKLKNSKRYRYTWAQQVRSMMGTAFEGPDQGVVRFQIEIAPDGTLTRLETLWSTSPKAEELARKAIDSMPPLPPTPTGLPLVFEKTISFQPFVSDVPPLYKDDCLPDPPSFINPYAWDGKSPQGPAVQPTGAKLDPEALEECLKQLPEDSIEAEAANDRREIERWRSPNLGN
jgi:TonB family protein